MFHPLRSKFQQDTHHSTLAVSGVRNNLSRNLKALRSLILLPSTLTHSRTLNVRILLLGEYVRTLIQHTTSAIILIHSQPPKPISTRSSVHDAKVVDIAVAGAGIDVVELRWIGGNAVVRAIGAAVASTDANDVEGDGEVGSLGMVGSSEVGHFEGARGRCALVDGDGGGEADACAGQEGEVGEVHDGC